MKGISDDLMRNILELLRKDARYTAAMIADMLGEDARTVADAIKVMEESGVIIKYTVAVNPERAGDDRVLALIEVKASPQREQGFDALAQRIYRFDEVRNVYLMSGSYDFMVLVEGETMQQVAFFVAEKLSVLDHVISTATHFVLRKYKEDGIILREDIKDNRLVVTP